VGGRNHEGTKAAKVHKVCPEIFLNLIDPSWRFVLFVPSWFHTQAPSKSSRPPSTWAVLTGGVAVVRKRLGTGPLRLLRTASGGLLAVVGVIATLIAIAAR
jgi:hypothetical protein